MKSKRRHPAYREQQLSQAAIAAGGAFGWVEQDLRPDLSRWRLRRRIISAYAPAFLAAPLVSSLAWWFYN